MIIELANVGKLAKTIEAAFEPAEIDLEGESFSLAGAVKFTGETERVGDKAHLRGLINADVSLDCTRCLEPIARHLEFPFKAIFIDSSEEDASAEAELGEDELDESLVENGNIDLAEVIREQLLLALPEQIFCREDCKGLCPQCGSNRNLIDCKCADDEIDPRWAALKNLK